MKTKIQFCEKLIMNQFFAIIKKTYGGFIILPLLEYQLEHFPIRNLLRL